jgi:hypothetical protein
MQRRQKCIRKLLNTKTENPSGIHRCKWENIIKMGLKKTSGGNVFRINQALDSVQWLDLANTQ